MYEMKDMTGSFFKNDFKKSDKQPDFKGKIVVEGRVWELAGWNRTVQKGERIGTKYMSLKVSEPREKGEGRPKKQNDFWD